MKRALCAAAAVAGLASAAFAGSASGAAYYSPGYKGTKSFRNITPVPFPPIAVGTGKYPNLLVDGAGTSHIVFAQDGGESAPDTLAFCNLQRGSKRCASAGLAPNPQAPDSSTGGAFSGNFPAGNHDFDGPVPLVIGNELFVVDRRFPDVFNTPGGTTSDSNVFEWSSADGGATLTGPGQLGDNQTAGGAVAYGDPDAPSIGTISRTETGGTFFQGTAAQYTTAKAQLGTGDQAYDGSVALDGSRPIAAFADLSGNVFVREWSGQGDPNDAATWTQSSFPGFSPRIVGGAAGVFVLYSDSDINGGKLMLRRITNAQPASSAVALGKSDSQPAISEDPTGGISFAYTDRLGVEVRTSSNGVDFSPPEFTASIPSTGSIAHLATAATGDGGGFVSFVKNPAGGEGVGQVIVSAFGDQRATGKPGLGPLPGGGIGSSAGDQLATSTCQSAKFGVVDAEITGPCFAHSPSNPNLDVTLGELNLNGLRIVPDAGVRIGIDPRLHTIDTTGKVRVELVGQGIDPITLWHDELHAKLPTAEAGTDLFDLHELTAPIIKGFPITGDVDIKLVKGGVEIPISLGLPSVFGGVTGSATLEVSTSGGLQLSSLEFKVGDANLAALELKDVDVTYQVAGDVWSGTGELQIPAGGSALDVKLAVEFANGQWTRGMLDLGLPYPGIPLDDSDPPPQLYLTHGGLDLRFDPVPSLTGLIGFGVIPIKPPGEGGEHDFVFSLDGSLGVSFGNPVTLTVTANGFLFGIPIENGTLIYKIPNQVSITGHVGYALGPISFDGQLSAFVDAKNKAFGGQITAKVDAFGHTVAGAAIAINNTGFGVYLSPFGTAYYYWNDPSGPGFKLFDDVTSRFVTAVPAAADRRRARAAAATGFTVPVNSPSVSLIVRGTGGAPAVVLISPDGQQITPAQIGTGASAMAVSDAATSTTYVGIRHPRSGRWSVVEATGSQVPITSLQYAIGESPPTVRATITGSDMNRTLRYKATLPANVAITILEQRKSLVHVIGKVRGKSGTIHFRPAYGPAGRRQVIAQITDNGLPFHTVTLGSYIAPPPPRAGRATALRVRAGSRTFTYSFRPPPNAAHTLLRIVTTDGRHLQRVVSPRTRSGSVPVIGFGDGVRVTVIGLAADGSRGPAVTASARKKK